MSIFSQLIFEIFTSVFSYKKSDIFSKCFSTKILGKIGHRFPVPTTLNLKKLQVFDTSTSNNKVSTIYLLTIIEFKVLTLSIVYTQYLHFTIHWSVVTLLDPVCGALQRPAVAANLCQRILLLPYAVYPGLHRPDPSSAVTSPLTTLQGLPG